MAKDSWGHRLQQRQRLVPKFPITRVVSMGGRNTLLKFTRGRLKT